MSKPKPTAQQTSTEQHKHKAIFSQSCPMPLAPSNPDECMRLALALAEQAVGLSDPNPRVGCVITHPDGQLIGQGHTQAVGHAHAEVMALQDAQSRGASVRGATAYVTLEPCAHHGHTPPCCDALIAAGIERVVVALTDPNPRVSGQGMARMRAAGLSVEQLPHSPLTEAAHALNIGFFSRMQRGRPWVRLKVALSLDGCTALSNGQSQWITGPEARTDGHAWRKRAGAVLTGAGTVRSDDPRLDVRLVPTARQPLRVVLDGNLTTSPHAQLLQAPGPVLFYATTLQAQPCEALQAQGAEVVLMAKGEYPTHINLEALLHDLAQRGINELHIEAGQRLNGAFIRQAWVDEYLIYLAPLLLGPGRGLSDLGPLTRLQDSIRLRYLSVTPLGNDLRILARPQT